ncbi:trans-1,2-dihydrobenzene-1,2-diol dehydrogenase [Trichonephila clavipes]|nr:trans-1,2-dihydrobenzene-1,2-diol dehydrogenase [Trichonephila clavipes]
MATKWGILSAGKICHDFVTAVQSIPETGQHEFVAVAARSLVSAKEFASSHNIPKAYGSYEDLAKDPNIEVVYIGTVASHHYDVGKLMLENGKHVLMEKPMTLNLKQTKGLIEIARKHKRFLMEPDDAFPPSVPGVSQYTPQDAGLLWWPAEQKICRQTKITFKEHLGWGIIGCLMNSTPVGKQERAASCPSPVDYWIPGHRGCSEWPD